jgi:hypothetical protein
MEARGPVPRAGIRLVLGRRSHQGPAGSGGPAVGEGIGRVAAGIRRRGEEEGCRIAPGVAGWSPSLGEGLGRRAAAGTAAAAAGVVAGIGRRGVAGTVAGAASAAGCEEDSRLRFLGGQGFRRGEERRIVPGVELGAGLGVRDRRRAGMAGRGNPAAAGAANRGSCWGWVADKTCWWDENRMKREGEIR